MLIITGFHVVETVDWDVRRRHKGIIYGTLYGQPGLPIICYMCNWHPSLPSGQRTKANDKNERVIVHSTLDLYPQTSLSYDSRKPNQKCLVFCHRRLSVSVLTCNVVFGRGTQKYNAVNTSLTAFA